MRNQKAQTEKFLYLYLQLIFIFAALTLLAIEGHELTPLNVNVIKAVMGITVFHTLAAVWIVTRSILASDETKTRHDHLLIKSAWWVILTMSLVIIIGQNARSFDDVIEIAKLRTASQQIVALFITIAYIESIIYTALYVYRTFIKP